MLTGDLAIVVYERGRALPDRLTRRTHAHYVEYAELMLTAYRDGVGQRRRDLHRAVEKIFADEPDCDSRRVRAFCKLLDDDSDYDTDRSGRAAKLRLRVFSAAAPYQPLVREPDRLFERSETEVKTTIARELGRPWEEIEATLYADVIDQQRLKSFQGGADPLVFLARYNVSQVQACLYRAERLTITATRDFKTILRQAKLARLLHEIERRGPTTYYIRLTGPASVLKGTRRYGVSMARFLPSLLACKGWSLEASLQAPWGQPVKLLLSQRDGLKSHLEEPAPFDSLLEEKFADRFGTERQGWRLVREGSVIHQDQHVFVPDFTFQHDDGTEVLFEIVGFWTPEYFEHKRTTLRRFRRHRILVAVPERSLHDNAAVPEGYLVYKTAIKPKAVLEALEQVRGEPSSLEGK
jgi:predicted nuclease of restriction endonuclease-like RecB superfamily